MLLFLLVCFLCMRVVLYPERFQHAMCNVKIKRRKEADENDAER